MKKIRPILVIVVVIGIIGYFDSPKFLEKEDITTSFPFPIEETTAADAPSQKGDHTLEYKLIDVTHENDYVVEVYREYEFYKDDQGNLIETIPTENYQYLRYKK